MVSLLVPDRYSVPDLTQEAYPNLSPQHHSSSFAFRMKNECDARLLELVML
jgi:hypothetical protein